MNTPDLAPLAPGVEVRISGISSKPALNDRVGTVVARDISSGRWQVRVGEESMKLKPEKLTPTSMAYQPAFSGPLTREQVIEKLQAFGYRPLGSKEMDDFMGFLDDGLNLASFLDLANSGVGNLKFPYLLVRLSAASGGVGKSGANQNKSCANADARPRVTRSARARDVLLPGVSAASGP